VAVALTVARWPNFRPNNSKQAPKIIFGREKSVAGKPLNLFKSCRKEAEKSFIEGGKPPFYSIFAAF
jgi:hypothetical protein